MMLTLEGDEQLVFIAENILTIQLQKLEVFGELLIFQIYPKQISFN